MAGNIQTAVEYPLTFQRKDLMDCIFFQVPTDKTSVNTFLYIAIID